MAGLGVAAIADTAIFRILPKLQSDVSYNGNPSEWIEFLAGMGLVVVTGVLWAKRANLVNAGIEELKENLILEAGPSQIEDLQTPAS